MFMRLTIAAIVALAAVPASAQTPQVSFGPMMLVAADDKKAMAVVKPAATTGRKFLVWTWLVTRNPPPHGADTIHATRQVDCDAGTLQLMGITSYNKGMLENTFPQRQPAKTPAPNTWDDRMKNAVCDGARSEGAIFQNHREFRTAMLRRWSSPPADAAKPPVTPSLPSAIHRGVDFKGNDVRSISIKGGNWAACQSACEQEAKCVAWTLYTPPPGNDGGCWLKHSVGEKSSNPHSISGVRQPR